MRNVANMIKKWREDNNKTMLELSMLSGIDQALISRYESNNRLPSEKHIAKLAEAMELDIRTLRREYLADKIAHLVRYEIDAEEILYLAESRVEYLTSKKVLDNPIISDEINKKLKKIDALQKKWEAKKPLKGTALEKMREYFNVKYTFDSNRIEGNTLSMQETHLVVNEGITVGGKSMREHLEAINHAQAVDWLYDMVQHNEIVNKRNLLDLHRIILKSIDNDNAGRYRRVPVRISGSEHLPPEPYLIDKMMEDYFIHYQYQKKTLHPVLLAAEMHERLVSIHPFIDGNGRTSRLIMNFILLNNGYTIAILKGDFESRMAYYRSLEQVQVNSNPEPFYHLIADKVMESLEEHLSMV